MQIPLSFAVPWNFSKEDIFLAEKWIKQQLEQHPGSEEIKAACHILTDVATEYRHQTGQEEQEPTIYPDLASAQEALDRGEWVRIEMEPYPIDPALVQTALDLQAKERLEEFKKQQGD